MLPALPPDMHANENACTRFGRWQDVLPALPPDSLDGIFFDTFGEYVAETPALHHACIQPPAHSTPPTHSQVRRGDARLPPRASPLAPRGRAVLLLQRHVPLQPLLPGGRLPGAAWCECMGVVWNACAPSTSSCRGSPARGGAAAWPRATLLGRVTAVCDRRTRPPCVPAARGRLEACPLELHALGLSTTFRACTHRSASSSCRR